MSGSLPIHLVVSKAMGTVCKQWFEGDRTGLWIHIFRVPTRHPSRTPATAQMEDSHGCDHFVSPKSVRRKIVNGFLGLYATPKGNLKKKSDSGLEYTLCSDYLACVSP